MLGTDIVLQGGFLVIQPDLAVFDSIVSIVREGSYGTPRTSGWRNSGIGAWWGGATIQGILPFFYAPIEKKGAIEHESLKYATARELDRCVYDNMVDPSVVDPAPYVGAAACRATPFAKVKAMHFTLCQKPWICRPLQHVNDTQGLCISFHERWYALILVTDIYLSLFCFVSGTNSDKRLRIGWGLVQINRNYHPIRCTSAAGRGWIFSLVSRGIFRFAVGRGCRDTFR